MDWSTVLIVIADIAVGAIALKLSKSNEKVAATLQQTQATMLALLTNHSEKLDNHEERLDVLEKAA